MSKIQNRRNYEMGRWAKNIIENEKIDLILRYKIKNKYKAEIMIYQKSMKYELRKYQKQAVQAMLNDYKKPGKSVLSLPTGSGKSLIIADFTNKINKPVIILQPSREILSQNKEKLLSFVDKSEVGVYSASFNSKQIKKYTFATIQSVYKKHKEFANFSTVIIDEAHLYAKKGMFDKFIKAIGKIKVFGLTATPYRLQQKKTYDYKTRSTTIMSVLQMLTQVSFDRIIYTISTKELIDQGFLCPIEYITDIEIPANFNLNTDNKIVESFQLQLELGGMNKAKKVISQLKTYKSSIVFTPTIRIAQLMSEFTPNSTWISGDVTTKKRKQIISDFKNNKIKTVFNCEVLTTGFDHPELDCICLMRPTKSLNLYNQMLGRGVRTAPNKEKCSIIDITGTTKHLGKLEDIEVKKINGFWDVLSNGKKNRNRIMSYYKTKRRS